MSSRAAVLSARPRVRRAPRAVSNEVDDAVFLASSYGLTPDPWQSDVLRSWLGRRADGRWSASTCGLAVARQNGKNAIIEVRELFGMVALGERILHTAHEVKTARKAFLRISSFFENTRDYPELAALVREIRKTNGQEAVVLHNGGSVEFIARSRSSGRGFTVDVLVCDEAQELTAEELEALGPTISASPSGNPQMIFTGTPPKPGRAQGEVFRGLRTAGQDGADSRLAWTDFGVADGPLPDVDDRDLWVATNPGLVSGRLTVAELERERLLFTPEGFAKERLCWWESKPAGAGDLDLDLWLSLAGNPPALSGPCFGVDLDEAGTGWVAVVWHRPDGVLHCQLVDRVSVSTMQSRVDGLLAEHGGQCFAGGGAAAVLEGSESVSSAEFAAACARFDELLSDGEIRHCNQVELNDAVKAARWRWVGTAGERAWQLKDAAGIGPLAAVTRAVHGATQPTKSPSRVLFV